MLCTSCIVDDCKFPHNGGNRHKSKTTSVQSPGGGTGGEVGRQRLHLVEQDFYRLGAHHMTNQQCQSTDSNQEKLPTGSHRLLTDGTNDS